MSARMVLPDDYVLYLDGLVRGNERRLAPLVRALSDHYVGKSGKDPAAGGTAALRAHPAWRSAYTFYYGPVNALKVHAIVAELAFRYAGWPGKNVLRLLDLGAGPGSATAGMLLWNPSLELDCVWVDKDPEWNDLTLVRPWIDATNLGVRRDTRDLAAEQRQEFDLVLAANVVAEMHGDVAARAAQLDKLLARTLAVDGVAILVEPALRRTTRDLHVVRQHLLAAGWHVLAPCTGHGACPMLANARDWCHETRDWIQPDFHHRLDQLAGLAKDALRFAFLAVARTPRPQPGAAGTPQPEPTVVRTPRPEPAARIVSEIRTQKGRVRFSTCDEQSRLAAWEIQRRDLRTAPDLRAALDTLRRGSLVRLPHERGGRLHPTDSLESLSDQALGAKPHF